MRKLDLKQPLFIEHEPATLVHIFPNGRVAAIRRGETFVRNFDQYGRPNDSGCRWLSNEAPCVVEVVTLYPNGTVYTKDRPVGSSQYGVENLIQVRVTRRGDQIIKKELL